MRKTVDITSKLTLEENPVLQIGDTELEVQANAKNVLQIMSYMQDSGSFNLADLGEICELVFTPESNKKLDELGLLMSDYQIVVSEAINLMTGKDEEDTGELVTIPATT